ncbi:Uncharacterised protein [Clostridium paraputrificum]|uniref:Uncharacterized protein n=1 Tax=Clostridium paraputrificum TaxID=29363 RepID=A0A6N3AY72_9CLOT
MYFSPKDITDNFKDNINEVVFELWLYLYVFAL